MDSIWVLWMIAGGVILSGYFCSRELEGIKIRLGDLIGTLKGIESAMGQILTQVGEYIENQRLLEEKKLEEL
jgi:hypothetical protein